MNAPAKTTVEHWRELLAFVGRHSPEAADAIRKSL